MLLPLDRDLVLALGAAVLEPGRPLREHEVNRRLADWLADVGAMVRTDHIELRRWLIDTGFVERDAWGHACERGPSQLARSMQILGSSDSHGLNAAVRAVRVGSQSARLLKRRAFEAGRPGLAC